MRSGLIVWGIVFAAVHAAGSAYAGTVSGNKARALWKFSYEDTLDKGAVNDFHIRLVDPSQDINVIKAQLNSINAPPGQSIAETGTFQNNSNNSKMVDIDFSWTHNYAKGQKFSLFLNIEQKRRNQISVENAYFTKDQIYAGGPGSDVGLNGFRWEDPLLIDNLFLTYGLGMGTLLPPIIDDGADGNANEHDDDSWRPVFLHDLKFFLNQPDYDFSTGDDSILTTLVPDFVLSGPIGLLPDGTAPPISITGWIPGSFIWVTGIVADSSDLATATYSHEFTFGHETAVPEPSIAFLVAVGLANLLLARGSARKIAWHRIRRASRPSSRYAALTCSTA